MITLSQIFLNKEVMYQEIKPSKDLQDFVHSFWTHKNLSDKPEVMAIFPDSFFKIVFLIKDDQVLNHFMTGLWTEQKEFTFPPGSTSFGCRLKILAPEFLIDHEISSLLNSTKQLGLSYLGIQSSDFSDFSMLVSKWEAGLRKIKSSKAVPDHKLRLSQLLYKTNGSVSASEVSKQIHWTNRQINRYLNKYLGVSLKKYLNIQKCYEAYIHIREGKLSPEKNYFDQAHFIREVKKHTGETPGSLHEHKNDRFIQLKNIRRE